MRNWILLGAAAALIGGPSLAATPDTPAAAGETTFLHNARQLTFDGRRAGEGYFSADGKNLIFQAEREADDPFYQIYILSLETGDVHRVSPGTGKTTCAYFLPSGDRVLFASTHLDPEAKARQKAEFDFRASGKQRRYSFDYDENFDIFSSKPDGSDLRRLTDARGYDAEGSYSPDGKLIVFCSMRDAYPEDKLSAEDRQRLEQNPSYFGEIYLMNADGSEQRRLTHEPGYDGGPFFTPDGKRIVWRHFTPEGVIADVYTMALDGGDRHRVTDFGAMSWAPFFHPSGDYLIFTSNKLGFENFELYIVDAEGRKEPVRVTFTDGFDGLPVFSPDGKRMAWTSNRTDDKESQLFIADWDDAAARKALADAPPRTSHSDGHSDASDPRARAGELRLAAGTVAVDAAPVAVGFDPGLHDVSARAIAVASTATPGQAGFRRGHEAARASFSPGISAVDMRHDVYFLASDDLEGRMTGSPGAKKAREYIEHRFKDAGLKPKGEHGYEQKFPFTSGVELVAGKNTMTLKVGDETRTLTVDKDFRPLSYSENGTVQGPVAFAGYGLVTPNADEHAYDAYSDFDVKGKVVLVLNYVPEGVDMDRRMELNLYSGGRYKAMIARERGAKALLLVTGPTSPNPGKLRSLGFDQSLAGSGIPVISITGEVADFLFKGHATSLKEVQSQLDVENPHAEGAFDLDGVTMTAATDIRRDESTGRNVIAYIPASKDDAHAPVLMIGAHYDHLGRGESGSLAHKGEEGQIHNGADDNASGTSMVMELAAALADARRQHPDDFPFGVVCACWSGEELGIIGSNYYADHPTIPLDRVVAYINFDMVGRLKDNTLLLQGVGSSPAWKKLIEKRNVAAGFNVKLQEDPYLPTDVTAFYPRHVPVLAVFTGSHEDYHRPTDDADKINYEGMERIGKFSLGIIEDIIGKQERPAYAEVKRSKSQTGASRAAMRIYLGTIPDYATGDIVGVKLSGVRGGGPADKGGLRGGDVIVECAGKEIKNIYDYTYALDALKVGEPVPIVVLRDGKRVTLTVVPEARQ